MFRSILLVSLAAACSSTTPGAHPHDMSTAQHEAAAQEHAGYAESHQGQYDSKARTETKRCRAKPTGCWTSVENPTAEHLRMADEHRRHAADHRAASAALRDAEAAACVGIDPDDRDISPFERVEDIVKVDPFEEERSVSAPSTGPARRTVGAIVLFRARPGMTTEWLQRVVDCHIARNASLGHVVPEMPSCPLVPKGISAKVTSTGNGFAIAIRSDDPAVAREVLDRARRSLRRGEGAPMTSNN